MKRTTAALPSSRITTLRGLLVLVTILVIGRMFQVSVIDHAKSVDAAKNQYDVTEILKANRGKIYLQDLNGGPDYPVALNMDSYMVVADPFLIKEDATMANALAPALSLDTKEVQDKLADKHKRYVILKKKLTKDEAEAVNKLNLKGVIVQTIPARFYPESGLAAQAIGFIDANSEGQAGIERYFNDDLTGYNGSVVGEKDAKRRIINQGKLAQPKDGTDIVLTVDHNLQFVIENKLKDSMKKYEAEAGRAVVMDVKTGAVLAMANVPGFDPNNYGDVPADQQQVFANKTVSVPWEPGSIFKTFTLAAGMDQGLYEPDTKVELACSVKVNGFEIHNSEDKCYGNPTIKEVLEQSINIGTIWAADKMGNDTFAKYISDFGFGSKTGIEAQPESAGRIMPLKQWQDVNRATISFGQGMSVTPIQMVTAYAAIANQGKLMKPYLVAKRIESDGREINTQPKVVRQVIKPETAAKATMMLEGVVLNGHGKKAAVPGYRIAGKTGTAQVVGEDGKYEVNSNIGSFAGFFPADDPKFAMVVILDRPKAVEFAESSAAPTFGEIAAWLLHYAKVAPTSPIPGH